MIAKVRGPRFCYMFNRYFRNIILFSNINWNLWHNRLELIKTLKKHLCLLLLSKLNQDLANLKIILLGTALLFCLVNLNVNFIKKFTTYCPSYLKLLHAIRGISSSPLNKCLQMARKLPWVQFKWSLRASHYWVSTELMPYCRMERLRLVTHNTYGKLKTDPEIGSGDPLQLSRSHY